MRKKLISVLKYTLIIIGIFIAAAIVLPIIYKKEIVEYVSHKANDTLNGKLSFKDIHFSLFKHFPKWSVSCMDISLISYSLPDSAELFSAREASITIDFWKLLDYKNGLSVQGIYIDQPTIRIRVDTSGANNYTILKLTTKDTSTGSDLKLDIEKLKIYAGNVLYDDRLASTLLLIDNLNHTSTFNRSGSQQRIEANSTMDSLTFSYKGIPYLNKVKWESDIQLDYIENESKIIFRKNQLLLNALQLRAEGEIKSLGKAVTNMDIHIFSPGNSFKDLYSILPNVYSKHFTDLQAKGTYAFDFKAKGNYNGEAQQYPAFSFECKVSDGSLKYTERNVAMENIQLDVKVLNSDPYLKDMEILISPLQFALNQRSFKLNTTIQRLKDNPKIKGDLEGSISLSDFSNFFPISKGTQLQGILETNIKYACTQSDIEFRKYENIQASGILNVADMVYASPGALSIVVPKAHVELSPKYVNINPCLITIGKSDLQIIGTIENPLALLTGKSKTNGFLNLVSTKLDINEISSPNKNPTEASVKGSIPDLITAFASDIKFSGKEIFYDSYHLLNTEATGSYSFDQLHLSKLNTRINENALTINGTIHNVAAYIFSDQKIQGTLTIVGENLDIDKLMYVETSEAETVADSLPFLVPSFMDMTLHFNIGKAKYGKMTFNKVSGKIVMLDEAMQFHDLSSQTMGGSMALNGVYASKNTTKPSFDFKYDLSKLKFQQIFNSVQSIKALAPLAQFIEGVFNSSFVCQGQLGKGMMPDLQTLNLNGIIETLDGAIRNFKPLSELGAKLNVDFIKNLNLKNTRNWIKVENGAVFIKDFKKKIEDIDMEVNGLHNISGPMDYDLKLRIPYSKFKDITKSSALETGMSYVKDLALKSGINLQTGSHINLLVNMTGKLMNAEFKIKILGSDGKSLDDSGKDILTDAGNKIKDTLTGRAQEEVDKIKKRALEEQKRYEDSLRANVNKKAQEAKDKAVEEIRKKAGIDSTLLKKGSDAVGTEAEKILKEGGKKEVDEIKDKLKDWNPFKKK